MKQGIHPDYKKTQISCVCGNVIETGSVRDNVRVEICSNCHPFYTGTQKIMDTEGRVERFNKRYAKKETK
ncbi:MAG: 50S ribosomal protein L31 [uncultured bacterium]|nr:MAG: 50S ribosomal protein L31 [uncultured bacterium]